jgi:hypothetical protein
MELSIQPGKVVLFLLVIISLLTLAHTAGLVARFAFHHSHIYGLVPMFDFNGEQNLPTFYSTLSLLLCSALSAAKAAVSRRSGARWEFHWTGLSMLFLGVALDEQFILHERAIVPLRHLLNLSGFLYFAWVVPYGLMVLVLAVIYIRFLTHLHSSTRRRLLIAAVLYLAGALGMEMIGAAYYERIGSVNNLQYELMATAEELLEMAGVIVFIQALLIDLSTAALCVRFTRMGAHDPKSDVGS